MYRSNLVFDNLFLVNYKGNIYFIYFRELSRIFRISDYQEDLKSGVLIDLYYYTIQFCRENNFTQEQTSALFSIIKKTHGICIGLYYPSRCSQIRLQNNERTKYGQLWCLFFRNSIWKCSTVFSLL